MHFALSSEQQLCRRRMLLMLLKEVRQAGAHCASDAYLSK